MALSVAGWANRWREPERPNKGHQNRARRDRGVRGIPGPVQVFVRLHSETPLPRGVARGW